jgi:hypothetical protein
MLTKKEVTKMKMVTDRPLKEVVDFLAGDPTFKGFKSIRVYDEFEVVEW